MGQILNGEKLIYLTGKKNVANRLLHYYLGRELKNIRVDIISETPETLNWTTSNSVPDLLLIDHSPIDSTMQIRSLLQNDLLSMTYVAYYNVPPETKIAPALVQRGLRGVIYENVSLNFMLKGIKKLLEGELWFSREVMSSLILGGAAAKENHADLLTKREKEVLIMMAAGNSNEKIATLLYISTHTVKNHSYKIFKKLRVPNRIQASLWAVNYL